MNLLFVMDPIEAVHPYQDTTFAIMLAAQRRGLGVSFCLVGDLAWDRGVARARTRPVVVRRTLGDHVDVGEAVTRPLGDFALVFMRKDPPVDLVYLHACHLLQGAPPATLVVNDPESLRSLNEKLYALQFPSLIPPTLVASEVDELLGTKLRALYQRKKGRDLFDLWLALEQGVVDPDALLSCFTRYMREGGHSVTRAQFEANLQAKARDREFRGDILPLLRPGIEWLFEAALATVQERLIRRLPGEPWRGTDS